MEAGVTLVGIDSFNIDSTDDGTRPVHSALLGAGIPIVEHMCRIGAVPDRGARFFAVPVKVKGNGNVSRPRLREGLVSSCSCS